MLVVIDGLAIVAFWIRQRKLDNLPKVFVNVLQILHRNISLNDAVKGPKRLQYVNDISFFLKHISTLLKQPLLSGFLQFDTACSQTTFYWCPKAAYLFYLEGFAFLQSVEVKIRSDSDFISPMIVFCTNVLAKKQFDKVVFKLLIV